MSSVRPGSYTRPEQLAYAIKALRKAKAGLHRAVAGLPDVHAAAIEGMVENAVEHGTCRLDHDEALDILRRADDLYRKLSTPRERPTGLYGR